MSRDAQWMREFLAARFREITDAHRNGATGFATCSSLTAAMDEAISSAFEQPQFSADTKEHIAVLALGGYGRAELCPKSDIDVMILCDSGTRSDEAEQMAKAFLHLLWDAGVDVGHSVRTIEDAMDQRVVDSWASMLESRYVCGNGLLAEAFHKELRTRSSSSDTVWFIEGVFQELASRHERYGNSVKLLEPNIKKSAGGLRDFQTIFWLYRATDAEYCISTTPDMSASVTFLDLLRKNAMIDDEERNATVSALQFLLRTRHEMHTVRKSLHDTLEYALQCELAEGLGYGPRADSHSVERFMREYYMRARAVYRFNQRLSQKFKEMIEPVGQTLHPVESIDGVFLLYEDVLSIDPTVNQLNNAAQVFEAFVLSAEHEVDPDARLRRILERSAARLSEDQFSSHELASMFRRVLLSKRAAKTLREMNDLSVLGKYIPEFGALVAFFQHSVYHYFTADEHTLIAIANVENLREQQGVLREVFRNLRRKDILYLAILFHDIAKPRGVADHEVTGVEMARIILDRIGLADLFADVAFLIRNHLAMEQIAFRRNIHDPETIKEFAATFERPEQLDYLYLLTYADLSAVNVNVWTDWKSSLLQELYQRAFEVLARNLRGSQVDEFHQSRHEEAVLNVVDKLSVAIPRERVHRHLHGMQSDSYIALFSEDEIGQHIEKSATEETVSTIFTHQEGHTEITVIAKDAPFALSKFCAVLSANDANIFDANIFTRDDGMIIDRFRVSDASTKLQIEQRICAKITSDLNQVLKEEVDVEHLFQAHRRKWKRRPKLPRNQNIRTDVEFEDTPKYTIIDVYAADSLGFLYRVTEKISKLGLDIYFAKIGTRMDGIVDAFYVLDRTGNKITDPSRRELIRKELLDTVSMFSEEQLA